MAEILDKLTELSISTAGDDVPVDFLDMEELMTAKSIENFSVPELDLASAQFLIGLSTEEDGYVKPEVDSSGYMLCFPLKNVNLIVNIAEQDPKVSLYAESKDVVEWSLLAQVRILVGGADNNPMDVVDADVFRFSPYASPVSIKIGDQKIFRLAIEMRYIFKSRMFGFEIVPMYSNADGLSNFDTESGGSIKLVNAGKVFYPKHDVMDLHNLGEFGRGSKGEYFPCITVELRNELAKNDLKFDGMLQAMLCFLHPPHQPVQKKYVRSLVIFAHVHRMDYLLNCMQNALISEPPVLSRHLLDHFVWGEKWDLDNLIRISLLRSEGSYRDYAKAMLHLPDYAASLSLELRQTIEDRVKNGWALTFQRLAERTPTKNVNRVVFMKEGGAMRNDESDLHTFAEMKSSYAFGMRH
ncbi:BTB domain-containing protein [Aphelenchoides bicaudatus]|nr:BTB domain-containing protein [Aphelenchoides bicaudatus]